MPRTPDYSEQLCLPRALLLDFGGVVVETENNADWQRVFARQLVAAMHADGIDLLDVADVERDLRAGAKADSRWKDAMSRPFAPAELRYDQFWGDFVAADWPEPALRWVFDRARELCRQMGELKQTRRTRVGMTELLDAADAAGVPVGIVSNTLMGVVHRDYLDAHRLTDRFAAQIYSDEVGVRKPNPRMIELGADAVGVPVTECWYVGDNFDRDALCGARAGVGGNIIMEARDTYEQPYDLAVRPHAIVADPVELRDLFLDAVGDDVSTHAQSTPV
ncbi:HAD family hydrolase [Microbacterium protaetiae]|uniref:HAD family hydrolase n=1 Tax=Microbacterium protaetiae TaxID=2509458 RepID=A0A4P6EMU6_9MICO|nr:HAD family hydrolase [Microbacterium protaetiae]QAY59198.1 HAD family hydrolase [Microbacterium protaetiae]